MSGSGSRQYRVAQSKAVGIAPNFVGHPLHFWTENDGQDEDDEALDEEYWVVPVVR